MTFQRARTEEQRGQRRQQVLKAAAAMLVEMPVPRLSLNELSRRAGLAKPNILRYFDSREAILLELLDVEMSDWIAELERVRRAEGTPQERVAQLAELVATSMHRRPVLCDLLSAQGAVLEQNISTEIAVHHKHRARQSMAALTDVVLHHLPELGSDSAGALIETTLLIAIAAWQCGHPSAAMLAAYESDPGLAALQINFVDSVQQTILVTTAGLLARRSEPDATTMHKPRATNRS